MLVVTKARSCSVFFATTLCGDATRLCGTACTMSQRGTRGGVPPLRNALGGHGWRPPQAGTSHLQCHFHQQHRLYRLGSHHFTADHHVVSHSVTHENLGLPRLVRPPEPQPHHRDGRHPVEERLRARYRSMRHWEYTDLGREIKRHVKPTPDNSVSFSVMSYNVLAQDLLEQHSYLYQDVDPEVLEWKTRSQRILRDLRESKADVLCLQEIQANHFDSFYSPQLKRLGYHGLFKKRTGDKPDGCAIFYRTSKFRLHSHKTVDYYKPSVKILNRDNIGLVVLLAPHGPSTGKSKNEQVPLLCVANTHLLYNPKRHDVKLAQLQVLFAELDSIAHDGTQYHPVVLTGDFNLSPESSIYRFISGGNLNYEGLFRSPELIPRKVNITDQCQHADVIEKRQKEGVEPNGKVTFSSGELSHQLRFRSAYPHVLDRLKGSPPEVTTHQDDWVTVDYIFYSVANRNDEGKPALSLLRRLGLLSGHEMESLGGIPNLAAPSDHVPLVASFLWQW